MKALVLSDVEKNKVEDIAKPSPKQGEVLVRVKACGICGSDIPRAYKDGAHNMPLVIGHEFAGEVEELGEGVDLQWLGRRVGIFPLIPCNECECCKNRKYEMCKNYSYLGSRRDGGFAEFVTVPAWNLIELPKSVEFEEAAMLEPMAVAVHAIRQVDAKVNDVVCVMGLGTIGLLTVMFLKEMGCKNILVVGNKNSQREKAIELGLSADDFCDSNLWDVKSWVAEKTKDHGIDVFFECIGKNESVSLGVELAAPSGKVCLVGNPHSDMKLDRDIYWKILRNQLTLLGTWNSSFTWDKNDDWHYVIEALKRGNIQPEKLITHRFELEDILQGFEIMRDKTEEYVKVMGIIE